MTSAPGPRAGDRPAESEARPSGPDARSGTGALIDRYGRTAIDLRVSLTDRCNLRCTYCMPAEGLPWLPRGEVLTDDEVVRLVRVAVERLGITEVRFTGGEPLIRPGLVDIVARVARLTPRPRLSLTTNGLGLDRLAAPLRAAGLDRVNVSLDTVDDERYARITRRRRLADVRAGLAAAATAGLRPVKINAVLLRGINDDEAPALLRFALAHGYQLRFIEQMPLDAQHGWDRTAMVTADEILAALSDQFTLRPDPVDRAGAPAETWLVDGHVDSTGGPARVGVIGSVTRPFCGDCDRTRLTADGQIRNCLFATAESDLRTPLREGADDTDLADRWRAATWPKRAGHGIDDPTFLQPHRPMSAIGG
ncbi:GTP 3',8-cyclase MoaA [Plantactinospora sp. GCM10030261]|uniref:GTP 3',8-cyclase MoaA n=1 Tax=Plantactinospora sp. GCM10030261 TaxID=3273420 RepID=UPI0036159D1E